MSFHIGKCLSYLENSFCRLILSFVYTWDSSFYLKDILSSLRNSFNLLSRFLSDTRNFFSVTKQIHFVYSVDSFTTKSIPLATFEQLRWWSKRESKQQMKLDKKKARLPGRYYPFSQRIYFIPFSRQEEILRFNSLHYIKSLMDYFITTFYSTFTNIFSHTLVSCIV